MPQNVRNVFDETGEWAHSSFDHRHLLTASGTLQAPRVDGGPPSPRIAVGLAAQRRVLRAVRRTLHREPRRGSGERRRRTGAAAGPAARPESAGCRTPSGSVVRHLRVRAARAVHLRQRGAKQRAPARGTPASTCRIARTFSAGASPQLEIRWDVFNTLNQANFDVPNRVFGTPNFGRIFSTKSAARDAARPQADVLTATPTAGSCRRARTPQAQAVSLAMLAQMLGVTAGPVEVNPAQLLRGAPADATAAAAG